MIYACLTSTQTYFKQSSGNHSAIDLTMSDSTVYKNFAWTVYDDTCGSDHFPILLQNTEPNSEKTLCWRLDKTNGEMFKEKWKEKLTYMETNYDKVMNFTEILTSIAKGCVPRNSSQNRRNRSWFVNKC